MYRKSNVEALINELAYQIAIKVVKKIVRSDHDFKDTYLNP